MKKNTPRFDILEIAELLDEPIQKGFALEEVDRYERAEQEIAKSLSHDPFNPHVMTPDSPYHNPYRYLSDGSYAPAPELQERDILTQRFYKLAGQESERRAEFAAQELQRQIQARFRGLAKSIDNDLFKGGLPIGTVHTYADGQRYKKVAEGKWAVMAGREKRGIADKLTHESPKIRASAHQEIERHANAATKIQGELKKRQEHGAIKEDVANQVRKEVLGHVRTALEKVYGGKLPEDVENHLATATHGPANDGPKKLEGGLGEGIEFADKPAKDNKGQAKHRVEIEFSHAGQRYKRQLDVSARSPLHAQDRVHEALQKKLGRSVMVHHISARAHGSDEKQNQL